MEEIWKAIDGYEGRYEISNLGRVKSLPKMKGSGYMSVESIMVNKLSNKGYFSIGLRLDKKKKFFSVHRLVALHFISNPENKPTVDHIDRNPSNNNVNNLRWATLVEQCENRRLIDYTPELRKRYVSRKPTEFLCGITYDEVFDIYIT